MGKGYKPLTSSRCQGVFVGLEKTLRRGRRTGLKMFGKYFSIRLVSVVTSLLIAVFLVVYIANLGGRLDEIVEWEVRVAVRNMMNLDPSMRRTIEASCEQQCKKDIENPDEFRTCMDKCRKRFEDDHTYIRLREMGIDPDTPPMIRIFNHYTRVIRLDLGESRTEIYSPMTRRSKKVIDIIAEALPLTILLFTTANIVIFFTNITIGLLLSRRYGTIFDKISVSLAPLSSMPGWFYGMILLLVFGIWLRLLPSGGWISENPPENPVLKALDILRHMILPISAWMLASVPIGAYNYRTFFLLFSTEEYVEYARVRGIPESIILRRYILRPTLPPIITAFALVLIASWTGAIITERIFRWPGLGTILYRALGGGVNIDAPVIVGVTTIYAYLLAITVLVLDIVYGILDPRVRVVGGE